MGVHFIGIDLARLLDRREDRFFRDLVEQDPVDLVGLGGGGNDQCHMGGDSLAFAVGVRCDQDTVRLLGCRFKLLDDRALAFDLDILGLEVLLDVDAQFALGQVHDMPDGGLDRVILAQILGDGLCLGRGFDYDE